MRNVRVSSWKQFKNEVQERIDENRTELLNKRSSVSRVLFRGQRSNAWKLETTLERRYPAQKNVERYFVSIGRLREFVATFSSDIPECSPVAKIDFDSLQAGPPNIHFLLYLRHHGYPSPLLDWTRSPYVAAYFALIEAKEEDVAKIYIFQEYCGTSKRMVGRRGWIESIGQWLKVHRRHVMQQSEYTYCFGQNEFDETVFVPHEFAFNSVEEHTTPEFNRLDSIEIPGSLREEALRDLFLMNVTPYALFGTEDSLILTAELKAYLGI